MKKSGFLSLLIPVAALIVTSTVITQETHLASRASGPRLETFEYTLAEGWNALALPFETDLDAATICEAPGIQTLYRWDDGKGPLAYDCNPDTPHNKVNFVLEPHVGYMFETSMDVKFSASGVRTKPKYDVVEGGNFYGFPHTLNKTLYAQDICKVKAPRNLTITEIYRLDPDDWTTHSCSNETVNNFEIDYGIGYMLWAVPTETAERPSSSFNKTLP